MVLNDKTWGYFIEHFSYPGWSCSIMAMVCQNLISFINFSVKCHLAVMQFFVENSDQSRFQGN